MTFEEEFPSLKESIINESSGDWAIEDFVYLSNIQEHCLDKQRVKKILNQANPRNMVLPEAIAMGEMTNIDWIKKELGL